MSSSRIGYDVDGPVATITLRRPEVANALDSVIIDELDGALDRADADDAVRVLVLAAEGKHFCSGHDLKELMDGSDRWAAMRTTPEGKLRHEQVMYFDRCVRLRDFRKPTIAAVQGACSAAGLMLACMCDLIVAADDARFSNPVLRMSGAAVELLVEPWELGPRKAKEFLLCARTLTADEAERCGMVNRVAPSSRPRPARWPTRWRWCRRSPPRRSRDPSTRWSTAWASGTRGGTTSWSTSSCPTPRRRWRGCVSARPAAWTT
jgi:enoyl-CoA hydratase